MSSIFRKKFDHTPQRVKRARKICLFLSKKTKELVASVVTNEHDEIIDKAIEKLLTHVQFKYSPAMLLLSLVPLISPESFLSLYTISTVTSISCLHCCYCHFCYLSHKSTDKTSQY